MAEIAFRDVRKNYGKLEVIHGVDLEVAAGEFIVKLGPSGCGNCCAWSPGSRPSPAARSRLAARWPTGWSRASAAAPWCSRTTPSIRT